MSQCVHAIGIQNCSGQEFYTLARKKISIPFAKYKSIRTHSINLLVLSINFKQILQTNFWHSRYVPFKFWKHIIAVIAISIWPEISNRQFRSRSDSCIRYVNTPPCFLPITKLMKLLSIGLRKGRSPSRIGASMYSRHFYKGTYLLSFPTCFNIRKFRKKDNSKKKTP